MATSPSEKLQMLRTKKEANQAASQVTEIKKMSLEDLEGETIQFGKAKVGVKFATAFEDHKWTDWFVAHYEKSDKVSHQKYITYVEKRLDLEIQQGSSQSKTQSKAKSKVAQSEASWSHVKGEDHWSEDSGPEMDLGMGLMGMNKMGIMEDQMQALFEVNKRIHHRMNGIESALNELISHIRGLKTEP